MFKNWRSMKMRPLVLLGSIMMMAIVAPGCADNPQSQAPTASPTADLTADQSGTLQIRANGEDFIRQGFTSKDGWKITFDHVYVTLADVSAYQTDPPYDAESGTELKPTQQVSLNTVETVDLAAGDEKAEPILVGEVKAPPGRYNALSWKMTKATQGAASGSVLKMIGTANKDGKTIPFVMKLDDELAFQCGEFVGENRKGTLTAGGTADLEATFHFDHLFGDAETPMTDELNQQALGFDPLAALATDNKLEIDTAGLQRSLSPEDFKKFQTILPSLGHVGEGHCKETTLAQR